MTLPRASLLPGLDQAPRTTWPISAIGRVKGARDTCIGPPVLRVTVTCFTDDLLLSPASMMVEPFDQHSHRPCRLVTAVSSRASLQVSGLVSV